MLEVAPDEDIGSAMHTAMHDLKDTPDILENENSDVE